MKTILFKIFVLVFLFTFFSCKKKNEYHKITYEIEFFQGSNPGMSNFIDIHAKPSRDNITVDRFNLPKVIRQEFWGLKKGDEVFFKVWGQSGYWFEMRVYVDDVLVSKAEIKMSSNGNLYEVDYFKKWGTNDYNDYQPIIGFTF